MDTANTPGWKRSVYLEYDWGLFLKSFDGETRFDLNAIGADVDAYGTFFDEREQQAMQDINRDYRISKVLGYSTVAMLLLDVGYMFYGVGESLRGRHVPDDRVAAPLMFLGIGISAGLEIGFFVKRKEGNRKFYALINEHNKHLR